MKSILYLHQYFNTNKDSGSTRSYEFSKELGNNGYKTYMVSGNNINRKSFEDISNFEYFSTNTSYSNSMSYLKRINLFLKYIFKSIIIGTKIKNIDIVFATSTPLTIAIPGYILSRFHRAKFIFEVRDVWPDIPIELGVVKNRFLIFILKKFELFIYNKANHIIVASVGMYKNLIKKGIDNKKITVITNMANIELYDSIYTDKYEERKKLGLKEEDFICIHPGTMGFVNGVDYILDVAKDIIKYDNKIKFLLIGRGKYKNFLVERKNKENIDNVKFLDSVTKENIIKIIKTSDLGIMLVRNYRILEDNSANKFFDFLAAGLPILINYGGWQKNELESHDVGFSCSPTDYKEMVNKILFLKENKERYREMSRNSKELGEKKYSRNICCDKFIQVVRSIN
ncbi:MAG: glycosyltransferase family 4 protein [Candidatus Atribacteria bacterium]|nr:glycosyltransferase family 4 protein [Candidatus Atribacteria bacterium]